MSRAVIGPLRNLLFTAAFAAAACALAEPPSIPGVFFQSPGEAPTASLSLKDGVASRSIVLPAVSAAERSPETLESQGADAAVARTAPRSGAREIGFVRDVPAASIETSLVALAWQPTTDGGLAAQMSIRSTGAEAMRAEIGLVGSSSGLSFRFAGIADGEVYGPYTWAELQSMARWSPVIEGDTMKLEITLAPGVSAARRSLSIARIAHQDISLMHERARGLKATGPGTSGSCNIDIACVAAQQPAAATNAASTARISFVMGGRVFDCSGQLINSTDAQGNPTNVPYFITANHCIATSESAASIQFYWFYQAATCRGSTAPTQKTTTGGGALLYTNSDVDATLIRLITAPPAGVFLVGWDATPPMPGTSIISLHHPSGDYTKYSAGTVSGFGHYCEIANAAGTKCLVSQGSYIRVNWSQGTTEGGSSGAGVYTVDASGTYRLRGLLHGGGAACEFPNDPDFFSRFDLAYPSISRFLADVTQPVAGSNAVEYYNVDLDHYFLTSFLAETTAIEGGSAGAGWVRTGYSFPVGSDAANQVPVCRFYGPGPNSHFYTAEAAECAQVKKDPGWTFEANAYNVRLPSGQGCPANTIPILRTYNNGYLNNNSNHRYTTSPYIHQWMQAQPSVVAVYGGRPESALRWAAEGTVMCAPIPG